MKRESVIENDSEDRVEGDTIILHNFFPMKPRVLKKVEIITKDGKDIRKILKTKNGRYLFN